jgi:hypothetical protein
MTTDSGGGRARAAEQGAGRAAAAERLRRLFRFFAVTQCRGRSPVYGALSEGVADSDALLDLLRSTPGEQRRPSLLLAAVNFLLAARPGAPLAAYYPVHGGRRPPDRDLVPAFTASLLSYLSAGARAAFAGQLDEAARRRPVAWVFAEAPGLLATTQLSVAALAGPLAQRNVRYLVGASLRGAARGDDELLATADPYLRWLALARHADDDFRWLPDDDS